MIIQLKCGKVLNRYTLLDRKCIEGTDIGRIYHFIKLPILDNDPVRIWINYEDNSIHFFSSHSEFYDLSNADKAYFYGIPIFSVCKNLFEYDFDKISYYNNYYFKFLEENEEWLKSLEKKAEN